MNRLMNIQFKLGFYGYVAMLLVTFFVFVFLGATFQLLYAAALWLYIITSQKTALRRMIRWPLIVFACFVLLFSTFAPIDISSQHSIFYERFSMGGMLLIRSLSIIAVAQIFATKISIMELTNLFDTIGFRGFGFILGISFHLLPLTHTYAHDTKNAMRLRGGFQRSILADSKLFLEAIFMQILKKCDLITASAKTRAYHPYTNHGILPELTLIDSIFIVLLLIYLLIGIVL